MPTINASSLRTAPNSTRAPSGAHAPARSHPPANAHPVAGAQAPVGAHPPAGADTWATHPTADPAGFASLLRRTQAAPRHAEPAAAPPEAANGHADANGADTAPSKESNAPTQRHRGLLKAKLHVADSTAPAPRETPAQPDTRVGAEATASEPPTERCDAPQTQAVADMPLPGANLLHWFAELRRTAPTGDAAARAGDAPGTGTAGAQPAGLLAAPAGQRPDLKSDADLTGAAADARAQRADAAGAQAFAGVLAEQRVVERPAQPSVDITDRTHALAGVGAGAAALAPTPNGGIAATAPLAVPIATPLGAPDFAEALGLRLAVLATDGVQRAELHLNPADMGPVSVQIVMEGTQARIDFGADLAATRQAIEAGLPELASALADAGFTLAGGGVSQHAGGRSGGGGSDPPASHDRRIRDIAGGDDTTRVVTAAQLTVTRGGIDLFV